MSDNNLKLAVEQFALTMVKIEDGDLERAWKWKSYDEGIRFALFRTYEELRELAARLSTLRIQQASPPTSAQHALGQYHAAYRDLQAVLLGISLEQMALAPAPGEWAVNQILPHMYTASAGFFANIVFALERGHVEGKPPVPMSDDDWDKLGWVEPFEKVLESSDLPAIFLNYDQLHDRILYELAGISQEELAFQSILWEDEPYPLEFRLHRLDSHFRQHTVQIEKTLMLLGLPPNEAKRLLRLIYNAMAEVESVQIGAWDFGFEQCRVLAAGITARTKEISQLMHS